MHASSSGLDLPMKVVDMLGAELPVLALDFPAISELLSEHRGEVFRDEQELADKLTLLVHNNKRRAKYQEAAKIWRQENFQVNWKKCVFEKISRFL